MNSHTTDHNSLVAQRATGILFCQAKTTDVNFGVGAVQIPKGWTLPPPRVRGPRHSSNGALQVALVAPPPLPRPSRSSTSRLGGLACLRADVVLLGRTD